MRYREWRFPRVEEANLALCLVLAGVCHFVPSAGMVTVMELGDGERKLDQGTRTNYDDLFLL
jgi:hypothetical protein